MTLFYPDVSNVNWGSQWWTPQGRMALLNFLTQLRGEGFAGVVHKASQGSGYADPYWQTCRAWCEQNDLSWLPYHYCDTSDPAAQAAVFVRNNGGPNVMLDFEAGSGTGTDFWNLVNAFNNAGVNVSLAYVPEWYWDEIGEPDLGYLANNKISLVSSNYPYTGGGFASDIYANAGGDTGIGWEPYGDGTPGAWQFTDSATIAGITVDCNAYQGTSLDAFFTGNVF